MGLLLFNILHTKYIILNNLSSRLELVCRLQGISDDALVADVLRAQRSWSNNIIGSWSTVNSNNRVCLRRYIYIPDPVVLSSGLRRRRLFAIVLDGGYVENTPRCGEPSELSIVSTPGPK